jgi:phenylalanyl-tRNA synthetase alpha chain
MPNDRISLPLSLKEKLQKIKEEVFRQFASQQLDETVLEKFRIQYLGRNGELTEILKEIGSLPSKERPELGKLANSIKVELTQKIDAKRSELKKQREEKKLAETKIDITLPGCPFSHGFLHPLTQTLEECLSIFQRYGFQIAEGPEIETDYYNFEALNIPKNHPARDMQDTFYISEDRVLRTHTSPVQIHVMEKFKPPIRVVAPGTVYRRDEDVSHTPMFHQIEGLLVDEKISMADLKGVLTTFVHHYFSPETKIRFRPSFFPFTEPSAELDIECLLCGGEGCGVCKQSGWLEVMGCGMVHPSVFEAVRIDPRKYSGFAFGMGIERIAMLKYRINDIRLFFENDLRFLRQF